MFDNKIINEIFSFLDPIHLTKCRQVCSMWKLAADNLLEKENLWRKSCQEDFSDIYKTAFYKTKSKLSWRNLYRSLFLWSKLRKATETRAEIDLVAHIGHEICGFQVLRDGEIGIHTTRAILYYDIKTLKQSNRRSISGNYFRYSENHDTILVRGQTSHLYVINKFERSEQQLYLILPYVKSFLLNNNVLYYVTLNNDILMCDLFNEKTKSYLLAQMSDTVMCFGYKNGVHILTSQRNIYSIIDKEVIFQRTLDEAPNLMHMLNEYNFLENLDWRAYFAWRFQLRHDIPQRSIRDITCVKVYGKIVFLGSNSGEFQIYHSPYLNNELNLFNTEPVKQYNFANRDGPLETSNAILQIDVIEGEDGHTVLVAMSKRIVVLIFSHSIRRNLSSCNKLQILETLRSLI
ncbi:uncharacterized protein [Maniola hyperantus]|uniref:uncharacterized protein n=1 Tax=Aphantopus hyperantus TaxID=2795564 RepID=UPI00212F1E7C